MKEFHKKEAPIVGYAGFGGGTSFLSKTAGGAVVDISEHFKSLRRTVTSDEDNNHYSGLWDSGLAIGEFVTGEVVFDVPGTYTWTVPNGVSVITVVTVGGGGAGQAYSGGGGGGALAYGNNISVTAGQNITVVVGHGGQNSPNPGSYPWVETPGGVSYVQTPPGSYAARAGGGTGGNRTSPPGPMAGSGGAGGTVQNGGGGSGGAGGSMPGAGSGYATAGGGGAGGYSGNGGNGGNAGNGYANSGSSGSGGGAGGGAGSFDAPPNRGAAGGGEGGGVGIYGQGPNGAGGPNANSQNGSTEQPGVGGSGGSGGTDGGDSFGYDAAGLYGGGGANGYVGGMSGAVRIIWPGNTRSFPSTTVAKGSYDSSYENVNDYLVMAKIQGLSSGRFFTGLNGNGATDEYSSLGNNTVTNNQGTNSNEHTYNRGRRPIREGKVGWNKITSTRNTNYSEVVHFFKKGDGFFNMFSYNGNGNNSRDIAHGLSSKPGFILILPYSESAPACWRSYDADNSNESFGTFSRTIQNDTSHSQLSYGYISASSTSSFTVTNGSDGSNPTKAVNKNGNRYDVIAFENSTICKTGYYTGTGSDKTIATGFDNGIQFFMYKRLNSDANPGGEWTYITGDLKTSGNNFGELLRGDDVKETKNMIESSGSNLTLKTNGSTIDYNMNGGQYVFLAVAAPSS